MSEIFDVTIIGAGTAGLSALRKRTQRFVIVNVARVSAACRRPRS